MNPMNLDDFLVSLEKKAGFPFEKSDGKKDEKDDSKKDSTKDDGEDDEDPKNDKKGEDKKGQEKSAAEKAGADLAKEVMEKLAASKNKQSTKGEEMNKQAQEAGIALAQALMKQANVGDVSTSNGITPGTVPNKTIQDLAAQVAEHDLVIQPTPGTDGAGCGGTVNQIFDAIVADAMSKGVKDEQATGNTAPAEGAQVGMQTPNQRPNGGGMGGESTEKAAAVAELVSQGADFDQAVSLVKAASEELEAEHDAFVKKAAFDELLAKGVSFDEAARMVKSASASRVNVEQEKKAAFDALIAADVDFDQAIALVNAKSQELYGN